MDMNNTYVDAGVLNDKLRSVLLPVTIYVGFEACLGFLGNIVVLFVFTFRYHSCNFRYFVLCLALTDVIACCTAISGEVVTQTFWYIYPFHQICKAKSFFNVFTVFAEAFCLLTIAVDRYRKVCAPLGWQIVPRIAISICVVIYIVSGIIAIPVAIFWGTHERVLNKTNTHLNGADYAQVLINVSICEIDKSYLSNESPELYTNCLETILSLLLMPMLILYILIARYLIKRQHTRKRSEIRGDERRGRTQIVDSNSDVSQNVSNNHDVSLSSPNEIQLTSYEKHSSSINSNQISNLKKENPIVKVTVTQDEDIIERKIDIQKNKFWTRVNRKTRIMFILTFIFIITTIAYLVMLELIADHILETLSDSSKAAYFFGFRFYFINHVINPVVYGFLDPNFRTAMSDIFQNIKNACRWRIFKNA